MKIIAIAIRTEPLKALTVGMSNILKEFVMDKRLKKAEAIKAYLSSDTYLSKKHAYQRTHAEFGQISEIAIADGGKVGVREGENRALNFLEQELRGAGMIVGFDLRWQLLFMLRRRYLTGATGPLRSMLFTNDGTATTATTDIKVAWMQNDKSYSGLTLADLCRYSGYAENEIPLTAEADALQVMRLYKDMEGNLL